MSCDNTKKRNLEEENIEIEQEKKQKSVYKWKDACYSEQKFREEYAQLMGEKDGPVEPELLEDKGFAEKYGENLKRTFHDPERRRLKTKYAVPTLLNLYLEVIISPLLTERDMELFLKSLPLEVMKDQVREFWWNRRAHCRYCDTSNLNWDSSKERWRCSDCEKC